MSDNFDPKESKSDVMLVAWIVAAVGVAMVLLLFFGWIHFGLSK